MFRKFFVVACLFALFMASCQQDEVLNVDNNDEVVQLSTQIGSIDPMTRADIGVDGTGSFIEGDIITLNYNQNQADFQLTGGAWTPELSWDQLGAQATFSAFYPSVANKGGEFTHTVALNQNSGNNFEQSDLLFASPVSVNRGETVQLNFKHIMSCMTVVINSNVYTEEDFKKASIVLKSYNQVQVLADGVVGAVHDYDWGVNNIPEITFAYKGGNRFQAIVCPQNVNSLSYGGWLKIKINGKEYVISEPPTHMNDGSPFVGFESGKNITFTYSINNTDAEFRNKTHWVSGLKEIPDITTDAWKYLVQNEEYEQKQLPWNAKYGWYDCNKRNPSTAIYGDQNLCWAASASNMIHWWLDQNKEYVDKYCQQTHVQIPMKYNSHVDSEVFQAFKDNFEDKGSHIQEGLNWFFLGNYTVNPNSARPNRPGTGGYFKKVFGSNAKMVEYVPVYDMKSLNGALKKAFMNHKAIGFHIEMPGFNSAHALTMWGASFDENVNASSVYYTENNDVPDNWNDLGVGLISAKVGKYEGTNPSLRERACLMNSQGKTVILINGLILLDLNKNGWKKYFDQQAGR